MKLLGIDYGSKRIGVAVSDENGKVAFPLAVVPSGKDAVTEIVRFVAERGVSKIIVGKSVMGSGKENPIMEKIKIFAGEIGDKTGLPVIFEDESLTSFEASRAMFEVGEKGKTRDDHAATLILQRYLERENNNKTTSNG